MNLSTSELITALVICTAAIASIACVGFILLLIIKHMIKNTGPNKQDEGVTPITGVQFDENGKIIGFNQNS